MTNPESIVTSLDWSKKLKEAGWPQNEGHFSWYRYSLTNSAKEWYVECQWQNEGNHLEWMAAPTAEDILRRLPERLPGVFGDESLLQIQPLHGMSGWSVFYHSLGDDDHSDKSLANAAAAMYYYLAEQKLLPTP